jgi:TP901 family phage tail tape measure protein
MSNLTSSLTVKLIDDVSKPARSVSQALKDAANNAKSVAQSMGKVGSGGFKNQLSGLKLTAKELRAVKGEWLSYAKVQKAALGTNWATQGAAAMRAWEKQAVSSIRKAKAAQMAFNKSLTMAGAGQVAAGAAAGRFAKLRAGAADFASYALPGTAGMAMGLGAGAVGGLAAGGAAAYAIKQAVSFDKAMAEVRKKVNLDAGASIADVETMINASARRLGIAREDVAGLVAQAGQAGVEFRDLAGFMDLTTKGAIAFDLPAREMAQSLAQLKASANLTNADLSDIVDMVNTLGDNSASSEKNIVEMLGRAGAAAKAAGVPLKATMAMTTAANSVGMEPEVASRFFTAMTTKLRIAENLPKKAQEGFKQLGLTAKQVAEGMKRDATGTILDFFNRVNKSANSSSILVNIVGEQWQDETQRLGQAMGEVTKNLQTVNDPSKWKGSADKALDIQLQTTANHLERLKALTSEVGDRFSRWALPPINAQIDSLLKSFDQSAATHKTAIDLAKSTTPAGLSVADYEKRLNLGLADKRALYRLPAFAQGPAAAKQRPTGGVDEYADRLHLNRPQRSSAPMFQQIEGATPHIDLKKVDAAKADVVAAAAQMKDALEFTAAPHVDTGAAMASLDALIAKANAAKQAIAGVGGAAASATGQVNALSAAVGSAGSKVGSLKAVQNTNFTASGQKGE